MNSNHLLEQKLARWHDIISHSPHDPNVALPSTEASYIPQPKLLRNQV